MSDLRITTSPYYPDNSTEHGAAGAAIQDAPKSSARGHGPMHAGASALESLPMPDAVVDVASAMRPDDAALANKAAEQLAAELPFTLSQDDKADVAAKVRQVLQAAADMGFGPLDRLDISVKANGLVYGVGIRGGVSQPVVSRDESGALQAGGHPKISIGVSTPAPPGIAVGVVATFGLDTVVSSGAIFGTATRIPMPGGGFVDYKTNGSTVQIGTNIFSTPGVPTAGLEVSFELPTARHIVEHLTGTTPQQQLWELNDLEASQHALNKSNDAAWSARIDARYEREVRENPGLAGVINEERERAHIHRIQTLDRTSRLTIELFDAARAPIQAKLPKQPAN